MVSMMKTATTSSISVRQEELSSVMKCIRTQDHRSTGAQEHKIMTRDGAVSSTVNFVKRVQYRKQENLRSNKIISLISRKKTENAD